MQVSTYDWNNSHCVVISRLARLKLQWKIIHWEIEFLCFHIPGVGNTGLDSLQEAGGIVGCREKNNGWTFLPNSLL